MKMMMKAALAAVMAVASVSTAHAQFGGELLGARAQGRWGGELGIGYGAHIGPVVLRPIGGILVREGDNDRYYRDTFSNGQSRCRDSATGQFADDSNCVNIGVDWYAKAEAAFATKEGFEIGGGARFSEERVRPYGLVAFRVSELLKVRGNVGDRYFAAGLSLGF